MVGIAILRIKSPAASKPKAKKLKPGLELLPLMLQMIDLSNERSKR